MTTAGTGEWIGATGDTWAQRWKETDRALEPLSSALIESVLEHGPGGRPVNAFDVGCGAGTTSIALATACPQASITACDISPSLTDIARQRTAAIPQVRVLTGDAEALALLNGPFDLILSRHGVMFFPDPIRAFQSLRSAACDDASLTFSCFQSWERNPWASELACATAGKKLTPPGREPSGFAFAEPDYVRKILESSGWTDAKVKPLAFDYVAGRGTGAVDEAVSFLSAIGPASRAIESLPEQDRPAALERMRTLVEEKFDADTVAFPAAAWIWSARPQLP